ncbi:hypothetical protein AO265_25630 [Pseudomonas sp. ABAC61]|nr:hypothetical protein AO265_25630 [Pseudomonas sp. ABAC61]
MDSRLRRSRARGANLIERRVRAWRGFVAAWQEAGYERTTDLRKKTWLFAAGAGVALVDRTAYLAIPRNAHMALVISAFALFGELLTLAVIAILGKEHRERSSTGTGSGYTDRGATTTTTDETRTS